MITTLSKRDLRIASHVMNVMGYVLAKETNRRLDAGRDDWKESNKCADTFLDVAEVLEMLIFKGEER